MAEGGDTRRPRVGVPKECLAPHAVARWAAEAPDRLAVVDVAGPAFTYRELDTAARTWAGAYRRIGVGAGDHVATLLPNGVDAHLAWLGLGWLVARDVPLNNALVGELLHDALLRSDATVLVVDASFASRLAELPPLPELRTVVVIGDADLDRSRGYDVVTLEEFLDGATPPDDLVGPVYRDVAVVLFTSGTTGPSKPVLVPWANVYQFWSWVPEDTLHEGEALYCPLPVVHNSGRSSLNYALVRGATFVYRERFSGTAFWDDVRAHDCKAAALVGPLTAFLHAQPPRPDDADNPLRAVICGPLIPDIEGFKARFGVKVATCYGMTETGVSLTTDWDHGPVTACGRKRPDYPWPEVRIVDENDEPLPVGEVGELVVRAAEPWSLNAGYYKMPEATAAAWRNGWFHTGDAFRCDEDGNYHLVDRLKDAIRRRGENISSFEVENIVRGYPGVADCAAIGIRDELGDDEVMVVVEPAEGATIDPPALREWLEPRMPKFMLPRYVDIGTLPRNATTQRVRKYELRERGITPTTWDAQAADKEVNAR
ncbi:MAG TPA: AMP-binding protein [Acidimicrobiales bacterium]